MRDDRRLAGLDLVGDRVADADVVGLDGAHHDEGAGRQGRLHRAGEHGERHRAGDRRHDDDGRGERQHEREQSAAQANADVVQDAAGLALGRVGGGRAGREGGGILRLGHCAVTGQ